MSETYEQLNARHNKEINNFYRNGENFIWVIAFNEHDVIEGLKRHGYSLEEAEEKLVPIDGGGYIPKEKLVELNEMLDRHKKEILEFRHNEFLSAQSKDMENATKDEASISEPLVADNEKEYITVLLVRVGEPPTIERIANSLEALQHSVAGYIETVRPFDDDVCIICNESGRIDGLPLNRDVYIDQLDKYYPVDLDTIIAGDFLVVGMKDGEFTSLTPELLEKYEQHFHAPQKFVYSEHGEIKAMFAPPNTHQQSTLDAKASEAKAATAMHSSLDQSIKQQDYPR